MANFCMYVVEKENILHTAGIRVYIYARMSEAKTKTPKLRVVENYAGQKKIMFCYREPALVGSRWRWLRPARRPVRKKILQKKSCSPTLQQQSDIGCTALASSSRTAAAPRGLARGGTQAPRAH